MQVLRDLESFRAWRNSVKNVGLVPTMGALHAGHLSLVTAAKERADTVLVSVFVNPTQFDNEQDLAHYPATLQRDLEQLEAAGVNAVFVPDFALLYPDDYRYRVTERQLSKQFCGAFRDGHFDGVLSVVLKLFNLTAADWAFFGEKDFQQLQLIRGMVEALFVPIEIIACPTVREADGLAMSSRNLRLSAEQRAVAPKLFEIISSEVALPIMKQQLKDCGFELDYLELMGNRLLVAATLGSVRLIDNVPYEVVQ